MGPDAALCVRRRRVADQRGTVRADLSLARAVLDRDRPRQLAMARLCLERPERHLCDRLSRTDAVRPPRASCGADDAGRRRVSCWCCSGPAVFTRVARERPRVGRALLREIRASFYRKLFLAFVLASIIPVLTLAFVIRTYFAGLLLENVEAEAARAAFVAQRVIEESAALQQRAGQPVALADRRRHDLDQPGHRSGRQRLRRTAPAGDERARPVRVGAAAHAHAGPRLPRDCAAAAAELRRRGSHRRGAVHGRRGAGPRRRRGRDPDRAAGEPAARDRARDRRARPRRPPRGAVLHPRRRGDRAVDGGTDRRSGAPADARHAPDRARRFRRADRRPLRRRTAPARRRLQQHGRRS